MPSPAIHIVTPLLAWWSTRNPNTQPKRPPREWGRLIVVGGLLTLLPDLDLLPGLIWPELWLTFHRAWGHNLFTCLFLSGVGSILLKKYASPSLSWERAACLALYFVGSHLVLDAMSFYSNGSGPVGVPLLWPFSEQAFFIPVPLFPSVEVHASAHPVLGHASSTHFWSHVLFREILGASLLLFVCFVSCKIKEYTSRYYLRFARSQ